MIHTQHDAGRGRADHSKVAPGEIAIGVIIGRASEYFDFFVFGIAAVLVFPAVFFPFEKGLEGTLYAFTVFSFAFVTFKRHSRKPSKSIRDVGVRQTRDYFGREYLKNVVRGTFAV